MTAVQIEAPGWVPVENVLIYDQRSNVCQALSRRMTAMPSIHDVVCVTDGFALVDAYAARPSGLVLIGIRRNEPHGPEALSLLLSLHPSAKVFAFGSASDTAPLVSAVANGAKGLMLWELDQRTDLAPHAPRLTVPRGSGAILRNDSSVRLTEREIQVLRGMSEGRSNNHIGRDLFLSEDTIKTHARRLFSKLGANDRAHAVALGLRRGHLD